MNPIQITTQAEDYSSRYDGEFYDYYQVHILSFNQVFSTYFHPKTITKEQLQLNTESIITEINKRSEGKKEAVWFGNNGKFLIAECKELLHFVELTEFNPQFVRYEPVYDYNDFFEFLGEISADIFLKKALITVGAEDLISVIEPQINHLKNLQEEQQAQNNNWRLADKNDPRQIIEFYKIEKEYKPVKVREVQSNSFDITLSLPEYSDLFKEGSRMAYVVKEISTNKVIENTINDRIESLKYFKSLKKNPPIMDLDVMQRMELDSDDPDFISYDDYTSVDEDD